MRRRSLMRRSAIRISGIFLLLLVFFGIKYFCQEKSNHLKIISFIPDFLNFWQEAENNPLEKKIALWENSFEAKHSKFYQKVIFEGLSGQELRYLKNQKLKDFFSSLQDIDVERMSIKEIELKSLIKQGAEALKRKFPEYKTLPDFYILPSLYTSDGAVRPYDRKFIVYFGLEVLIMKKDLSAVRALIVHESFHGLHLGQLNEYFTINYGDQSNLFSIIHREGLLFFAFMEGLAVYATEEIYPTFPKAGLVEENILQYEKNFLLLAKEFLYDQKVSDFLKYRKYFGVPSNDPTIPEKFGYWLGYRVIKELIKKYSLQEMMAWEPKKVNQMALVTIQKMLNET